MGNHSSTRHSKNKMAPTTQGRGGPGVLVGRDKEVNALAELYTQDTPPVVLVTGPRGIGKTKLTIEFGFEQRGLFLGLNGHNFDMLRSTIVQTADLLRIRTTDLTYQKHPKWSSDDALVSVRYRQRCMNDIMGELVEVCKEKCRDVRIILVIDNVNELETIKTILASFTEFMRANCFIIINLALHLQHYSEQWKEEHGMDLHVLPLPSLDSEGAKLLIRGEFNDFTRGINSAVQTLVETLQKLPVLLLLVCVYIKLKKKHGNYTVADYLELYQERKRQASENPFCALLQQQNLVSGLVWDISLAGIKQSELEEHRLAMEILRICVYSLPEQIPYNFLAPLLQRDYNLDKLDQAVTILIEYALLDGDAQACRMHRQFQEFMRVEIQSAGRDKEIEFLTKLMGILAVVCDRLQRVDVLHAISLMDYAWTVVTELVSVGLQFQCTCESRF